MIKNFAWSGIAVVFALVMGLGLVVRPAMAAAPTTVNVIIEDADDTIDQPITDVSLVTVYALITDGTAGTSGTDETIVTFSTTAGTFLNSGTATQQVQCAIDDVATAASNVDASDENKTFSVTSSLAASTAIYNGEAEDNVTDNLVAQEDEEGCIGVAATLIVPKNQPTGQIIITATTTNGKTGSEVLTIASPTGSTNDPSTITVISGQPQNDNIGYTSSTAQYNPLANGTRWGIEVKDSDGNRVNGLTIEFSTDAGVLTDDDSNDTGTSDTENVCDSTTNMGTTVFATTAGSTGTTAGRAYVILCGTSGSAGKTATITAKITSFPTKTVTNKVGISAKPSSADIKATVDGNTISVECAVAGIPCPDNTNIRFSVVPTTDGAVASSCTSLDKGKASTSVAATPGKQIQVLVTATEVADPGAANDGTSDNATLCATTDGRTYGSTSVVIGATTGGSTGGTGTGTISSGSIPAAGGFGLVVYGGPIASLVTASGCPAGTAAFWATVNGNFVTYVPGTTITAVNADFMAAFPNGIPAGTPLIGKCK